MSEDKLEIGLEIGATDDDLDDAGFLIPPGFLPLFEGAGLLRLTFFPLLSSVSSPCPLLM